jgi:hypothetical protein
MSQLWNSPPSQLMGMTDSYTAYCYDEAIFVWASAIEAKLEGIKPGKGKNATEQRAAKQETLLKKLLGITKKDSPGQFRDPMALLK